MKCIYFCTNLDLSFIFWYDLKCEIVINHTHIGSSLLCRFYITNCENVEYWTVLGKYFAKTGAKINDQKAQFFLGQLIFGNQWAHLIMTWIIGGEMKGGIPPPEKLIARVKFELAIHFKISNWMHLLLSLPGN